MSAAPVPPPIKKPAICKTPLSMFEALLDICNFTQLKCFGYVLNETTAPDSFGKTHTWARIKPAEFAELARTSEEWAMAAVDSLIQSGLLEVEYIDGKPSQPRYRIAPDLTAETKAAKVRGKCRECQWIGMFATEFVPLPRTAFTKLAPAVDHATYICTLVVARHTHHWNGERGLWIEPCELVPHDFRITGLEPGMIKQGLDKAVELGLIKRRNRAGKPNIYESCPENWTTIAKRPLREITPPQRGAKDTAKQPSGSDAKNPIKAADTPPIESGYFRSAICPKCARVVEIEPIPEDLPLTDPAPAAREPSKQPARAAPPPAKRPISRQEEAWEELKRWHTQRTIIKP